MMDGKQKNDVMKIMGAYKKRKESDEETKSDNMWSKCWLDSMGRKGKLKSIIKKPSQGGF